MTFYVETWKEKTNYTSEYILYESEQLWKDDIERKSLLKIFHKNFPYEQGGNQNFTLQQLKDASKILNLNLKF